MAEDMGEKTEDPTPKRLSQARERGQVARSQDLSGAILLTGGLLLAWVMVPGVFVRALSVMRFHLSPEAMALDIAGGAVLTETAFSAQEMAAPIALFMACLLVVAATGSLVQVGLMLSPKALEPSLKKLDPIQGAKKLFSKRSLVKAMLDIGKFVLIGTVCFLVIGARYEDVLGLVALPLQAAVVLAARLIIELALWALLVLIILGVADFMYQKWQHKEDMKMTKQEVKDERKSAEGDMEMKGRRFRLARSMAMQRIQNDVPRADVVVTNPTHYSVALKYDSGKSDAPRVVAKGADYLALRIRYVASAHGVPIVERAPLARALYAEVPVGGEISPQHFEAVAEVLAYVYRLEGRAAAG